MPYLPNIKPWSGVCQHERTYASMQPRRKQEKVTGKQFRLSELVGEGYEDFWNFKGRYRVVKGSRGSKKSYTMAYWIVINMMAYPEANTLVVRQVEKTHRTSTFALLKKVIWSLGLHDLWQVNSNTMTIIRKDTGQEIRFAGMDNPLKITSSDVTHGKLCWVWFEEAYEVKNYEDFAVVDESIRGELPEGSGLWNQITMTFNPWRSCWLKTEFFDRCELGNPAYDPEFAKNCLCKTTTHTCNEWLTQEDHDLLERYKYTNPRRYQVVALGDWGTPGEVIYENWDETDMNRGMLPNLMKRHPSGELICGLDFGWNHCTALVAMYVDVKSKHMWVYDEVIMQYKSNSEICRELVERGYRNHLIIADSADPKAIDEMRRDYGFWNVQASTKGVDSVEFGIQYIQGYKIHIFKDCIKTLSEIRDYCYETDDEGKLTDKPLKENDDCMDAMRYGMSFIGHRAGFILNK